MRGERLAQGLVQSMTGKTGVAIFLNSGMTRAGRDVGCQVHGDANTLKANKIIRYPPWFAGVFPMLETLRKTW